MLKFAIFEDSGCLDYGKVRTNSMRAIGKILKEISKGHKHNEFK